MMNIIITPEDLGEYEVKPRTPFSFAYDSSQGFNVYMAPVPFGGPSPAVYHESCNCLMYIHGKMHNLIHMHMCSCMCIVHYCQLSGEHQLVKRTSDCIQFQILL